MPAKKKITREAIIQTAIFILRKEGFESINTRNIAAKLKCSTQPIYSEFKNMDELKLDLKLAAQQLYVETVKPYTQDPKFTPYMAYGLGFICFAKKEKQLFRYLFMCDRQGEGHSIEDINAPRIIQLMTEKYGFTEEVATRFHYDMTVYTYGLAVLLNTNYQDIEEEEIIKRLRTEYVALCRVYDITPIYQLVDKLY